MGTTVNYVCKVLTEMPQRLTVVNHVPVMVMAGRTWVCVTAAPESVSVKTILMVTTVKYACQGLWGIQGLEFFN